MHVVAAAHGSSWHKGCVPSRRSARAQQPNEARIEILKECVHDLARVAFLWNPDNDSNHHCGSGTGPTIDFGPDAHEQRFRWRICGNYGETTERVYHD
jgi:hypothetical protein